jgi:hypothetical protein
VQRLADAHAFYRALPAEFPLVLAFVEIAQSALVLSASERRPSSLVRRELGSICGKVELRVGAKIGGDLFGPELVNTESVRFQCWIHRFKFAPHLVPREAGLRHGSRTRECHPEKQETRS